MSLHGEQVICDGKGGMRAEFACGKQPGALGQRLNLILVARQEANLA